MKKKLLLVLMLLGIISIQSSADPGKGKAKGHYKNNIKHDDWDDDDFKDWIRRRDYISRNDYDNLRRIYEKQLRYERQLRKDMEKYYREISRHPYYSKYDDPMKYFIDDMIYNRRRIEGSNFSPEFQNYYKSESDRWADLIRAIVNLK